MFDMVAKFRENNMLVMAEHCPSCGRWARVTAGDKSASNYWVRTSCGKCGVYETHDWPASRIYRLAKCDNYREDLDQPCSDGILRFPMERRVGVYPSMNLVPEPGVYEAPCDQCGGRCGYMVANYMTAKKENEAQGG